MNGTLLDATMNISYVGPQLSKIDQKTILSKFMQVIDSIIAGHTPTNYHGARIIDNQIILPVNVLSKDDATIEAIELLHKRITIITDYFRSIDWRTHEYIHLWYIKNMVAKGVTLSESLIITGNIPDIDYTTQPEFLEMPSLNIPPTVFDRAKLCDGSLINTITDPLIPYYTVCINASVPYADMGMSYNALHLYEHLMTKCWQNCSGIHRVNLNGATYPNGNCFIYAVCNTIDAIHEYLTAAIRWLLKSRADDFWTDPVCVENIKVETQRTISETADMRNQSCFARSDARAYSFNYDTKIFTYWSNRPFDITVIGPKFNGFALERINADIKKRPIRNIQRPRNARMKHPVMEALDMGCRASPLCVMKCSVNDIRKCLLSKDPQEAKSLIDNRLFGIDNYITGMNDVEAENNVLMLTVILNRLFTADEITERLKNICLFANNPLDTPLLAMYMTELGIDRGEFVDDDIDDDIDVIDDDELISRNRIINVQRNLRTPSTTRW